MKRAFPSWFLGNALKAKSYICLDRKSNIGITKTGFRKIVTIPKKNDDRRGNRSSKGGEKDLPFSGGFVAVSYTHLTLPTTPYV